LENHIHFQLRSALTTTIGSGAQTITTGMCC